MVCIGVIGAMEEEVASLINQMEDAESKTMAGMTFNKGKLWNQDAVVVQSGIGKVNMAICTQILVNIYGVDMLINTDSCKYLRCRYVNQHRCCRRSLQRY